MKLSTRQYAKRQISWIRNKLIPVAESANKEDMTAPFYLLDATGRDYTSVVSFPINLFRRIRNELGNQCSKTRDQGHGR